MPTKRYSAVERAAIDERLARYRFVGNESLAAIEATHDVVPLPLDDDSVFHFKVQPRSPFEGAYEWTITDAPGLSAFKVEGPLFAGVVATAPQVAELDRILAAQGAIWLIEPLNAALVHVPLSAGVGALGDVERLNPWSSWRPPAKGTVDVLLTDAHWLLLTKIASHNSRINFMLWVSRATKTIAAARWLDAREQGRLLCPEEVAVLRRGIASDLESVLIDNTIAIRDGGNVFQITVRQKQGGLVSYYDVDQITGTVSNASHEHERSIDRPHPDPAPRRWW